VGNASNQEPELLILGASVRAAAQSAVRAGYRVIAADRFADGDLRAIARCFQVSRFPGEFAEIRRSLPATPVVYTGALENYPDLLDEFIACGSLLGNDSATVQRVRDPVRVYQVLAQSGIPTPIVQCHPPVDQAGPWMSKPLRSAGGHRVRRWEQPLPNTAPHVANCYFQQFIPGVAGSAAFVAGGGDCQLLGVTEMLVGCEWTGADGYTYCGSIQQNVAPETCIQWRNIGAIIAREFALTGLFGVDGVVQDERVWPIEVNPRYTASMELIERSVGISLLGAHVDACLTGRCPTVSAHIGLDGVFGKAILFAPRDLRVPAELIDSFAMQESQVTLADLPQPGKIIQQRHPMLTVIAVAPSRDELLLRLRRSIATIFHQTVSVIA